MDTIGQKLKYLVKLRKIKQVDIARDLGISTSRFTNYLSGKREPELKLLARIADYLDADLNYFSDVDFSKNNPPHLSTKSQRISKNQVPVNQILAGENQYLINIPIFPVTAKRHRINESTILVTQEFVDLFSLKSPVILKINAGMSFFKTGDYILAEPVSVDVKSGDMLIVTGRNCGVWHYIEDKKKKYCVSLTGKSIIDFTVNSYTYVVKHVISQSGKVTFNN